MAGAPVVAEPPGGDAGRALDFRIGEGFGDAPPDNIRAVIRSAAETIWKHGPDTRWQVPGFFIFQSKDAPITLFDHHADGRIAIGLTTQGTYWAQFAYQFAHEFCHALAGHANDWRRPWIRERKANHWLEESLCETASLFALRAMAAAWRTAPPYPNWKDYAAALRSYADDWAEKVTVVREPGFDFRKWFAENEAAMRANGTLRERNAVVALQLLPLFEAAPKGWEAVTFLNLTDDRKPDRSLADHFRAWRRAAPEAQHPFIASIAGVFGLP